MIGGGGRGEGEIRRREEGSIIGRGVSREGKIEKGKR